MEYEINEIISDAYHARTDRSMSVVDIVDTELVEYFKSDEDAKRFIQRHNIDILDVLRTLVDVGEMDIVPENLTYTYLVNEMFYMYACVAVKHLR